MSIQNKFKNSVMLFDKWCQAAQDALEGAWYDRRMPLKTPEDYKQIKGIVTRLEDKYTFKDLRKYPKLKFIASCTTGLDHIDLDECFYRDIKVISLKGETEFLNSIYATAEHTWALIMSLVRKIPFAFNDVRGGRWEREAWQGTELRGKTLGVIGYGRVGKQLEKYAEAFGMNYIAIDEHEEQRMEFLLSNSDVVTVHVPLNKETHHMFGRYKFAMMKPTAYFINTSRGAIVDIDALVDAVTTKKIAGAALDVLEGEPKPYAPWITRGLPIIVTPHIAGNTAESRRKTQIYIANRIKDYLGGG